MKAGFTILEIIVVLVIVSIMGTMLFTSLTQINFGVQVTDTIIDESQRALIIHQQIEKDFMGVMMPVSAQLEDDKKEQAPKQAPSTPGQPAEKPEPKTEKPKEKQKPTTKVFFANNKDANLDTLTFITNNPLRVYWSEKIGTIKPCIARVVYRLVPVKETKNVFTLMRQEGTDLNFDAYKVGGTKEIREFVLAENIKSCAITYHYIPEQPKESENNQKKDSEQQKKEEPKKVSEWNSDDKEQKKKRAGKEYPDWITVTCALWDVKRERVATYEFVIQHIALGMPPTAKVEELALPGTGAAQQTTPVSRPQAESKLELLGHQINGMLSKSRTQLTVHNINKMSTGVTQ